MRLEFYGANKTTFQERGGGVGVVIKTTEMLPSRITENSSGMSSIPALSVSL
jgi:hypothetical protein